MGVGWWQNIMESEIYFWVSFLTNSAHCLKLCKNLLGLPMLALVRSMNTSSFVCSFL